MIKPPFVAPTDQVNTVGRIFNTPMVVKGWTWLPITQLIAWLGLAWYARRRHPERSWEQCLGSGVLTMPVVLGSEWAHNLAHAAAARSIAKPMDALRITWGMPLIIYYEINDLTVTPRQHIWRASGGPLINALFAAIAGVARGDARQGSIGREIADAAYATNLLIGSLGLLPIPGIDGGPILKWSLVEAGRTPAQADLFVRKTDGVLGAALALTSVLAFKKRRWWLGGLCALLAVPAFFISSGLLKEQ